MFKAQHVLTLAVALAFATFNALASEQLKATIHVSSADNGTLVSVISRNGAVSLPALDEVLHSPLVTSVRYIPSGNRATEQTQKGFTAEVKFITHQEVPRMYPPISVSSDGSILLYTRYFVPGGRFESYVFCGKTSDYVVAFGRIARHCITTQTKNDAITVERGTYISFSSIRPRISSDQVITYDDTLPKQVLNAIVSTYQVIFNYYQTLFGKNVGPHVTLLIQYTDPNSSHTSWRGDTVAGNIIRLRFIGKGWLAPTLRAPLVDIVKRFVAHEIFHFWNADVASIHGADKMTWLHEGGAEVVSNQALYDQHIISKSSYIDFINMSNNICLLSLASDTWLSASPRKLSGLEYKCGVLFNTLISMRLNAAKGFGYYELWKNILHHLAAHGEAKENSIKALFKASGLSEIDIQNLNNTSAVSLRKQLTQELTSNNIRFNAMDVVNDDIYSIYLSPLLSPLLDASCKAGQFGFVINKGKVSLDVNSECSIPAGSTVSGIEGLSVRGHASDIYQSVVRKCKSVSKTFDVSLEEPTNGNKTVQRICPKDLPPLTTPINIETGGGLN